MSQPSAPPFFFPVHTTTLVPPTQTPTSGPNEVPKGGISRKDAQEPDQ